MNKQNHGLRINFHGAAGTVTGSSTIIRVKKGTSNGVNNILIDCGSSLGEQASSVTNDSIDAVIFSHPHSDHIGEGPLLLLKNPTAETVIPEGGKRVTGAMMNDAWKFRQKSVELGILQTSEAQCRAWLAEITQWENKLPKAGRKKHDKLNRKGRKGQTLSKNELTDLYQEIEARIESCRTLIEARIESYYPETETPEDIQIAIDNCFRDKKNALKEMGVVTNEDVQIAISRLKEITIGKAHKLLPGITVTMRNSGHLITAPATQILITTRGKNILFSGDRGNNILSAPYPQPDDAGLINKADFLVLESTYGGRTHNTREKELQKMDEIIIRALKNGEDIIIPSISLDRPLVVLFEIITRLIDTKIIDSAEVDIFYFGNLMEKLLGMVPKDHPMWQKIKKHIKVLSKDRIQNFEKPGKKPRIIIAGGGFLPADGSPVGAILENALSQKNLTIIFPNYHGGPQSNAGNLMAGREFFLTRDNQSPHILGPGHKAHYISGFSGHADSPQLVDYAAKVIREKGIIYLNHGTDEARKALKNALEMDSRITAKHVKIVIPLQGRDYVLKKE